MPEANPLHDDDLETVGSRLRKRRRIGTSKHQLQPHLKQRSPRYRKSRTNINTSQSEVPSLEGSGDLREFLEGAQIDPRLSDNVPTNSRATNTEPERPLIAGVALRRSQGTLGTPEASEDLVARNRMMTSNIRSLLCISDLNELTKRQTLARRLANLPMNQQLLIYQPSLRAS